MHTQSANTKINNLELNERSSSRKRIYFLINYIIIIENKLAADRRCHHINRVITGQHANVSIQNILRSIKASCTSRTICYVEWRDVWRKN